jgi:hypothetical protein
MRFLLLVFITTFTFTAHAMEVPDLDKALDAYIEAVESGDANKVVALYDKDAVFYSMIATKPLKTQKERLEYYKKVVAEPDMTVDIDDFNCESIAYKATCTGLYTFRHTLEGEEVETPGKFVFKYTLQNDKWIITEHRSTKIGENKDQQ